MPEEPADQQRPFPPTAAALDERDRRRRRQNRVQVVVGAALVVTGVLGGITGNVFEWIVAACGAASVCVSAWSLLRYRRWAADQRCSDAATPVGAPRPGRRGGAAPGLSAAVVSVRA